MANHLLSRILIVSVALSACAGMSDAQRGTPIGAGTGTAAGAGIGVNVVQTPDNHLRVDVPGDISFDVDHAGIEPDFRPVPDSFAGTLRANPVTTVTTVAPVDRNGGPSVNVSLSVNRAASTQRSVSSRGVGADRIAIDGRGALECRHTGRDNS